MRWESWQAFWAMGGYGLYVWGSFAVTALALVIERWWLHRGTRALRRELAAQGPAWREESGT